MQMLKSFWASVQEDPHFMRRLNGWLTVFWIAMIPVSIVMGWLSSVAYVSALSLWALVSGHWAAWQAARVEVNQEREQERKKNARRRSSRSTAARGRSRTLG
jgi:uncharacterized membrane protein